MAHVKVQRRSMRPEEYNSLRYGWLRRLIYENRRPVGPVMIRNARQTGENDFVFYDETPYELRPGDLFYTPDGSVFFELEADDGGFDPRRPLYLYFETTSEVIVKVNGKYAGGFDPNRKVVEVSAYRGGCPLQVEMLGFNRSKPDDERNPETMAKRGCRQVFDGIFLCNVNETAQSLCYDLELLTDLSTAEVFDPEYRAFVSRETNQALNLIDFEQIRPQDLRAAAAYIEAHIYGDNTWKGSGGVALVAHSHLDIAYYWRRIHTVQKNLRTVLIQMRLMDKYPGFTYCHTQPYLYETLKDYYPEVFAELKEKVAAGRFEPVGAMYVEPDCNIPNAESLIRQCLYGQRFWQENFGFTVDSCWLPDVFGNSCILPQILKKSGVDYFVSNKMSTWNDTNRFPHNNFRWRGLDGTEVFACVPPTHFISWNEPSQVAENWEQFQEKDSGAWTLQMFGYGDGGSGATEEMIELMRRFQKLSVLPETRHMTAKAFLRENFTEDKPLPVWDGELYLEMHRGTFTTKARLKKYNRELEEQFRAAELVSLFGENRGHYPADRLRGLYKRFLLQQFHDILPGSHITPVYEDAANDLAQVEEGLREIVGGGKPLANLTGFAREGWELLPDSNGPFVRKGVRGRFARISAAPFGEITEQPVPRDTDWLRREGDAFITGGCRIIFAPDGSLRSLRYAGAEYAGASCNALRLYDDKPGMYDAWDILPDYENNERPLRLTEPLCLTALTPEAAEFTVTQETDRSRITRIIRLFRDTAAVDVEVVADWHESHKLLKADFGTALLAKSVVCDTSAGFLRRPTQKNTSWEQARFECCSHKWFVLDAEQRGLAVLNDGKYGVGITRRGVSLSLLRATERPDPQSDLGRHNFCYRIVPLAQNFNHCGVQRQACCYNAPLVPCGGLSVPPVLAALAEEGSLYLQAAKLSEDGERIILRLVEQTGDCGVISLPEEVAVCDLLERPLFTARELSYAPFEILTLAVGPAGTA